jgi:hypothetical protein
VFLALWPCAGRAHAAGYGAVVEHAGQESCLAFVRGGRRQNFGDRGLLAFGRTLRGERRDSPDCIVLALRQARVRSAPVWRSSGLDRLRRKTAVIREARAPCAQVATLALIPGARGRTAASEGIGIRSFLAFLLGSRTPSDSCRDPLRMQSGTMRLEGVRLRGQPKLLSS